MRRFVSAIMIVVIAVLLEIGMFGGILAVKADAAQERPLKIWFENENGKLKTYCLVDEKTGVNYIVVATDGGNGGKAPTITPRLNADVPCM